MNILIAGGTGFIGKALVSHFLANSHHVIVVSRDSRKVRQIFADQVESLSWEELNSPATKNIDVVINLAGANISSQKWSRNRRQEIMASRIQSTERIVYFCTHNNTRPLLINASAIGVYGSFSSDNSTHKIYDEKSYIEFNNASDFLAKVAREWEKATWPARDLGLRVVNVRFGVVLGKEGGILKILLPNFKLGLGAKIGSGCQAFTWVSLDDAVRAIQFIIDTTAVNGPINIVSPQVTNQNEFSNILASVLHRPRLLILPKFAVKWMFGNMGEELLLKGIAVEPTKLLNLGFKFADADLRQTLTQLTAKVSEIHYVLLKKEKSIEIREYDELTVAEVEVQGERYAAINLGFRLLANYIFGNNQKRQKIEMTAPVMQKNEGAHWLVRFVMPKKFTLDKLPKPNNDLVKLTSLKGHQYVVIVFSGLNTDKNLQKHLQMLLLYIKKNNLEINNAPIMSFYNPPWILPFLRRNEIWFELRN